MVRRFLAPALIVAAMAIGAHRVDAQTSSVAIVPEPASGSDVAPTPLTPLEVTDIDYPFDSLIANEEGDVTVALAIDSSGKVGDSRLVTLSRYQLLNQESLRLAGRRWEFHPALRNGIPADSVVRMRFNWRLPLAPVPEFRIALPAMPEDIQMPKALNSHNVAADDYPVSALRDGRQGIVALRYFVDESGSVGETRIDGPSGIKSLDDAATALVKRWKFEAAKLNGAVTGVWMASIVSFEIRPAAPRSALRCYQQPIDYDNAERILLTATLIGSGQSREPLQHVERWFHVDEKGNATEALLSTKNGLMRVSPTVLGAIKESTYPRPAAKDCWYLDPLYVPR